MPITAKLDPATGRLISRVIGNLSYDSLRYHLESTRRRLAPAYSELFDAREAYTDLTTAQVQSLAHSARELFNGGWLGPTAIVATNSTLYGMARMFEALSDGWIGPVSVFRDLALAERWLTAIEGSCDPNGTLTSVRSLGTADAR